MMESDEEDSISILDNPEDVVESVTAATLNLLPNKSKKLYLKKYNCFMKWRIQKGINSFTKRVLPTCLFRNEIQNMENIVQNLKLIMPKAVIFNVTINK
jgi:hypothetical protein